MKTFLWLFSFLVFLYLIIILWLKEVDSNLKFDFESLRKIPLKVERGFLWGSATSAYQVEGNVTNCSWNMFESEKDENGNPRILDNQYAGEASDQWRRYKEDIKLMKNLHLNAYRFSVEWSRIEPQEGKFDEKVLEHYEKVVDELLANGIEPMITLHHFTNPIWFEKRGAFESDDSPHIFAKYVDVVFGHLRKKVKLWCTINEPTVYAFNGYYFGNFPPAQKNLQKAAIVFRNMMRAHSEAYLAIKRIDVQAKVGIATAIYAFDPSNWWNPGDALAVYYANKNLSNTLLYYLKNGIFDFHFPFMAKDKYESETMEIFDFIGINYYTRFVLRFNPFVKNIFTEDKNRSSINLSDMGWEIYPEGLYRVLKLVSSYTSKPIYITENGIADDDDTKRAQFIENHLLVMNKAISEGMNIKGYFYWSLIDNYEWTYGFSKHFGLYKVDFATQQRTLRKGSLAYPQMINKFTTF